MIIIFIFKMSFVYQSREQIQTNGLCLVPHLATRSDLNMRHCTNNLIIARNHYKKGLYGPFKS